MTYMRSWKSHRLTSHTWLGLNPQIGRPLPRIVVPLVYSLFFNSQQHTCFIQRKSKMADEVKLAFFCCFDILFLYFSLLSTIFRNQIFLDSEDGVIFYFLAFSLYFRPFSTILNFRFVDKIQCL
jgi:hypothetical protein